MFDTTQLISGKESSELIEAFDTARIELETIERRLGTDGEQTEDFDEARRIAHHISNLKMLMQIRGIRLG